MPKKLRKMTLEELCERSTKVSVSWRHLFEMNGRLFNVSAKREYDARIRALIDLGILDFRRKNNYQVRDSQEERFFNPYKEGTMLYFTNRSDAEKVSRLYPRSVIERYRN